MKNKYLAAFTLAAILSPALHASTSEIAGSPASSCFMAGKTFSTFNAPYQMDTLEAGHSTDGNIKSSWQLDQGINQISFRENEGQLMVNLSFSGTRIDEYTRTRVIIPQPLSTHTTNNYFTIDSNSSAPVSDKFDPSNQQVVFAGKEVFCNQSSFTMVISDQQLFTPSGVEPVEYDSGPGGLLLTGKLDPDSESGDFLLQITSLRDQLESVDADEIGTISTTVYRTYETEMEETILAPTVTVHQESGTAGKYLSSAIYNAIPKTISSANAIYEITPVVAKSVYDQAASAANSVYDTTPVVVEAVKSAFSTAREADHAYNVKLARQSARNDEIFMEMASTGFEWLKSLPGQAMDTARDAYRQVQSPEFQVKAVKTIQDGYDAFDRSVMLAQKHIGYFGSYMMDKLSQAKTYAESAHQLFNMPATGQNDTQSSNETQADYIIEPTPAYKGIIAPSTEIGSLSI